MKLSFTHLFMLTAVGMSSSAGFAAQGIASDTLVECTPSGDFSMELFEGKLTKDLGPAGSFVALKHPPLVGDDVNLRPYLKACNEVALDASVVHPLIPVNSVSFTSESGDLKLLNLGDRVSFRGLDRYIYGKISKITQEGYVKITYSSGRYDWVSPKLYVLEKDASVPTFIKKFVNPQ